MKTLPLAFLTLLLSSFTASAQDVALHHAAADQPGDLKPDVIDGGISMLGGRGTLVVRLQAKDAFGSGSSSYFSIYPGPPRVTVGISAKPAKPADLSPDDAAKNTPKLRLSIKLGLDDNGTSIVIDKGPLIDPGSQVHFVWTWSGPEHRLYVNGELLKSVVTHSRFPSLINSSVRFLDGVNQTSAPVEEIALYNFTMSPGQIKEDMAAKGTSPYASTTPQGPLVTAEWGPGENKAYVSADSGNPLADQVVRYRFEAIKESSGVVAHAEAPASGGTAAALFDVPLPAGKYTARAVLLDAHGTEIGSAVSEPWTLPEVPWLRNNIGISDAVQPPWTPIESAGTTLKVWGRTLQLDGGFGLPQQITSQDRKLLSQPVTLEIVENGKTDVITPGEVKVIEAKPGIVHWQGKGTTDKIDVTIDGSIEYDGMILLHVTLAPKAGAGPVNVDEMRLLTTMPKDRALFLNTSTDQSYWWYSFKNRVPEQPGIVLDNLKQKAGKTTFLYFALLGDYHTGLEWFADNLAGWQVDQTRPVQEVVREDNGDVQFLCYLANQAFTLSDPIAITFGYSATPTKPLPPDWRSLYSNHHRIPGLKSDFVIWWDFNNGTLAKFRRNDFTLLPEDVEGYGNSLNKEVIQAPFTNEHVLLPAAPDTGEFLDDVLQAETSNDHWEAMPTRGLRDYWAWNIDQWIKKGGMDSIYIDELQTGDVGSNASPLSGTGWARPDGTIAYGHNTLGLREQLKRLRQTFIDNGKRPLIWLPAYSVYEPHVFSFVDITSDGESYMFNKPEDADFIDEWSGGLLQPLENGRGGGGAWLASLGQSQKFGSIPLFLNYIRFYNKPEYLPAMRAQYGLLSLMDIIPIDPSFPWWFKIRENYNITAPDITFHGYYDQSEIVSDRDDVKVSYYHRNGSVLAVVTNLGKEPFDGTITTDLQKLGLPMGKVTPVQVNGEKLNNIEVVNTDLPWIKQDATFHLSLPAHDFRMIQFQAGPIESN